MVGDKLVTYGTKRVVTQPYTISEFGLAVDLAQCTG